MTNHQKQLSEFQVLVNIVLASCAIALGLVMLVACATTPQASAPQSQQPMQAATAITSVTPDTTTTIQITPQSTNTVPPVVTMLRTAIPGTIAPTRVYLVTTPEYYPTRGLGDPNRKSAADTRVAQNHAALATSVALTPSRTPGSPTATCTPAPTATETIGWIDCGGSANSYENQYYMDCWRWISNGHLRTLKAGRQGREVTLDKG